MAKMTIIIAIVACFTCGCRSGQIRQDYKEIREALIELGEQQVLDNVARIASGQAFVHLDYGAIIGDVTSTTDATATGGKDDTDNAFGGPVTASNMIGNIKATYSFTGKQTNQAKLSLAGTPARDAAVYKTYLTFVGEAQRAWRDKDSLIKTATQPSIPSLIRPLEILPKEKSTFSQFFSAVPEGLAPELLLHGKEMPINYHKIAKVGDEYFWIPNTAIARQRFVQLYAETTLRERPKETFSEEIANQLNLLRLHQQP